MQLYALSYFLYSLKNNIFIILPASLLCMLGIISLYYYPHTSFFDNYEKQIFFFLVALILAFIVSFIDYRSIISSSCFLLAVYGLLAALLIGLFFLPGVSGGIKTWYTAGPFAFDPAQFMQLALLIILAKYFFSKQEQAKNKLIYVVLSGAYSIIPFILVFLQPNLGTALVFIILWLSFLFISGARKIHIIFILLAFILVGFAGWNFGLQDYQKERILSFTAENKDILGSGWNQYQSQVAIGSAGVFGKGLGEGTQTRLGFLPESHTDFMFAAIVEELGTIGMFIIFGLFTWLFYGIFKIAQKSNDFFAYFFCLGYVFLLLSHIILNVGSNVGLLPVIGLSLPFVSYGGSFLISLFLGIGIIMSINNHKKIV